MSSISNNNAFSKAREYEENARQRQGKNKIDLSALFKSNTDINWYSSTSHSARQIEHQTMEHSIMEHRTVNLHAMLFPKLYDRYINNMPFEILFKIFSYLAYPERCRAAKVCREWHAVVNDSVFYHANLFGIKHYLSAAIRFSPTPQQIKTKVDKFYQKRKLLIKAVFQKTDDYLSISLEELSRKLVTASEQLFLGALKKPCNDSKKYAHALAFFICAAFQDLPLLEEVYESAEKNIQVPEMKPFQGIFSKLLKKLTGQTQKAILISLLESAVKIKNSGLVNLILNVAKENEPDVIDTALFEAYAHHEKDPFCDNVLDTILESDNILTDRSRTMDTLCKFDTLYPFFKYTRKGVVRDISHWAYRLVIQKRISTINCFHKVFVFAVEQKDIKGLRDLLRLHPADLSQDIFTEMTALAIKNQNLPILQMLYEFYVCNISRLNLAVFEQCSTSENKEISTWWKEKKMEIENISRHASALQGDD